MPRPFTSRLAGLAVALLACAAALPAQQRPDSAAVEPRLPETIRGKVEDDSGRVLAGAQVVVTRGPDRLVQQTTTDSAGLYSVRFAEGTGDYLVYVAYTGVGSARRRVQREGSNRTLVANFRLSSRIATLAAVNVRANAAARATRNNPSAFNAETGSSERWTEGVANQLPPTAAGSLDGIASTTPGITVGANGPTILGADAASNLATLNGVAFPGGSLPRAARTQTRVTGATYDPTRGGFAGANIDVRLGAGDRFFQRRNGFFTFDPPALQFTDAVGRSLGAANGGFRGSFGADGEMIRRAATYNMAVDVARTTSDPATLLDASRDALLRAGVSPDSAERLREVAGPLGLATAAGIAGVRQRDAVTWLGRFDDTRDTLQTRTLTTYAGWTREGAIDVGPLVAPGAGGEQRERTLGLQLAQGVYVGALRNVLMENRLALSQVRGRTSGYRELPGVNVLVRSADAGAAAASDVSRIALGGAPFLDRDDTRWTVEAGNEMTWNARGRAHRFRTALWGRGDGLEQEGRPNALGTFSFNSIADLEAGRPSSFTRTLAQPARAGTAWNGAAALSHQWIPSRFLSLIWGARLEGNAFGATPARNAALEQALGVRTGAAPTLLHVSPRLGFTWQHDRERRNGMSQTASPVGSWYRYPSGVLRGGIGEFRDLLRPSLVADAAASTGLPDGTTTLACIGAAVPAADWARFAADPTSIPDRCADDGGVLTERAPVATIIDPSYDVPRSWRATLDYNTYLRGVGIRTSMLASYDLNQPSVLDANFAGTPRFALASEGGRPVYVTPASIDPASGGVSAAESRRSSAFGRVGVRAGDLRGYGGQLTMTVSPRINVRQQLTLVNTSLSYTLQGTRRQYRGFDGAGFGDPRDKEWAAGPNDARHILMWQASYFNNALGGLTVFLRAQSGLPFTPLVQGDVNGDGAANDRAFVPDPAREADPALAEQIQRLLDTGSGSARRCVLANLGRTAGRNSCRGPWTATMNMQWSPQLRGNVARRAQPTLYLQNVLGGVDQLLHGRDLRGWGVQATPDANLLVPRGFDAATQRFRYDVNPRFADVRPGRNLLREPFRLVLDVSVDLGVPNAVQQLRRAVEPVKTARGWERRSADSLTAFYLSRTSSLHRAILAESDSLFLTTAQIAALQRADSVYSARVRELYLPLGRFLAARATERAGRTELDSVRVVEDAYWRVFWEQPEIADAILTPLQKDLFGLFGQLHGMLSATREIMGARFGYPVPLVHGPAPVAGGFRAGIQISPRT